MYHKYLVSSEMIGYKFSKDIFYSGFLALQLVLKVSRIVPPPLQPLILGFSFRSKLCLVTPAVYVKVNIIIALGNSLKEDVQSASRPIELQV